MAKARLADIQLSKIPLKPGDKLIVRTRTRLEPDVQRRIRRTIQKWAGEGVDVLIYCKLDMEVEIEYR